jgi:anti-anti-sigma regulatory factor
MSEEEVAWTRALEQKRKLLVHALAVGDLETAEQLKETIEEMERHARSRGWRIKEH